MTRVRALLAGSLLLLPLRAACEPTDKDLLIFFAKEWGKEHGLYDDKGNRYHREIGGYMLPVFI